MADNINIKFEPAEGELIIRNGKAPEIYDPVTVTLSGTITAPADYIEWELNRLQTMDELDSVDGLTPMDQHAAPLEGLVVANYTARTIELTTKPRERTGVTKVSGRLDLFPALAGLAINQKKTYDKTGLVNLLKFQRAYFADRDAHAALLDQLKRFEAKVSQEFKNQDDYKGTAAQQKLTSITTNIPLEFSIAMPIFTGGPKETFKVDICVGLGSGGVDFWLESADLHDLIITGTDKLFDQELARLKQFAIIKQY